MPSAARSRSCAPIRLALALAVLTPIAQAEPLRVLMLSGMNNHDWTRTTPAIEQALEADGRFAVDVTEDPSSLTPETLAPYDAVLSNWTNFPSEERVWGTAAESALLGFVEEGGGLVVVHAAIACFPTWRDYREVVGAAWETDVTGHGAIHPFDVTITEASHPIARNLGGFRITDELWHRIDLSPHAQVIARAYSAPETGGSGRAEPVALALTRGKGRCFTLVLGHDTAAMSSTGWRTLLRNGAEWAATGDVAAPAPVDPDEALQAVLGHTRAADRTRFRAVEQLVQSASANASARQALAARLAAAPGRVQTPDAEAFLIEQLGLIGGPADVPAIAARLGNDVVGHRALESLRRIGGPAAAAALREALPASEGALRAGVIEALGALGDAGDAALLAPIARGDDDPSADAAIHALGRIGTMQAAEGLRPILGHPSRAALAEEALLQCAAEQERLGRVSDASGLYGAVLRGQARTAPSGSRCAALAGRIRTTPGERLDLVRACLRSVDPREVAVGAESVALLDRRERAAVAQDVDALPAMERVRVLAILADAGDSDAVPMLREVWRTSGDAGARQAAWEHLASIGDESTVTHSAALTDPGPNLALGAMASSPDGIEKDGEAGGDAAAVDGDAETYWDEADGQPLYRLRVTLSEPREVGALRITGWQHHNYAPRDFDVLCDGAVVLSVRGAWYDQNQFAATFSAARCTTVELVIMGYYGQSPAVRELELFHAAANGETKEGGAS